MLKGEPLQSPGLTGLTNRYLLIYSQRCSKQGTREPARGWTLFQSKCTDWLWTSWSLGTPFAFATTYLCPISLVTLLVKKFFLSTMRCHVRREQGLVAQRHDTLRDLLTSHISKVCRNVEREPLLQPLDNEPSVHCYKSRSKAGYEGRRFLDSRSNGILWRTCNAY